MPSGAAQGAHYQAGTRGDIQAVTGPGPGPAVGEAGGWGWDPPEQLGTEPSIQGAEEAWEAVAPAVAATPHWRRR